MKGTQGEKSPIRSISRGKKRKYKNDQAQGV